MRIFIAGGTGAVGSRLVPLFVAAGHEVTGTSRTAGGVRRIAAAGGRGVIMDGRDAASVRRAVLDARSYRLFVLQSMSGRDTLTVARAAFPFFLLLLAAVFIITEYPQIVLWLPKLAFPD